MKREVIEPIKIFYSYSRSDKELRDQLAGHLAPQEHAKRISTWYDLDLPPGTEWESVLRNELDTADIILLLVSADFLKSKYCYGIELKRALERHNAGEARVIPIILRQCNWKADYVPFSKLTALPNHHLALTEWTSQDAAFAGVATSIETVVDELIKQAEGRQHQANLNCYREKVKEFLQDGKISVVEQHTLDECRDTWGITKEEAEAIQAEEQTPHLLREESRNKYRRTFLEVIRSEYPLSQETRSELKGRQQALQLSDEEIDQIEAPIIAQKEAEEKTERERIQLAQQQAEEQERQRREAEQLRQQQEAEQLRQQKEAEAARLKQQEQLKRESDKKQQEQAKQPQPDAVKGNYAQLETLLKAGKWKEADQETAKQMCEVMGRQNEGWLRVEDIQQFPCADLRTIDQLWKKYSKGKFGFSVQKQIWKNCGSPMEYNANWEKFGDRVGWRTKGILGLNKEWKSIKELTFDTSAPEGHLPLRYGGRCTSSPPGWGLFFSHAQTCKL